MTVALSCGARFAKGIAQGAQHATLSCTWRERTQASSSDSAMKTGAYFALASGKDKLLCAPKPKFRPCLIQFTADQRWLVNVASAIRWLVEL